MAIEELSLEANDLRFHALASGPEDGPLVLLLHGFPELAQSWRHQLPALADAGYRAVAPDLRGYGKTEVGGPYDPWTLADDVAALVRALGNERAVVAGHDWGGLVAWLSAVFRPEVVGRLVVLNAPHPPAFMRMVARSPRQLARSSYVLFFQLPWLPERLLSWRRGAIVERALRAGTHVPSPWAEEQLAAYREAFADPVRVRAALGYYRTAARNSLALYRASRARRITAPTLVLWGVHDPTLRPELVTPERLAPWFAPGNMPDVRLLEEAGHFVQNEAPERVTEELLHWLASSPGAAPDGGSPRRMPPATT